MKGNASFRIRNAKVLSNCNTRLVDIGVRAGKIRSVEKASLDRNAREGDYDAKGRVVLPGFIDCHAHLFSLAIQEDMVQLQGSRSIVEIQRRIRTYQNERDQKATFRGWVMGRGWDQDYFCEKRLPTRHDLDKAVGDFPAILTRVCGHIAVLNSFAVEELSKGKIFQPFGEKLVPVATDGNPTGIVKEAALEACWKAMPKPTVEELELFFLRAQKRCLGYGLTGVHCILSADWVNELACIRELDSKSRITLKVSILLPISALNHLENMKEKARMHFRKGRNYFVIGFKLFSDGSLGARTAALKDPYSDDRENRGMLCYSSGEITGYSKRIKRLGMVLASHAIGDRAIEQVLNAYKRAGVGRKDGFRIEHCSVLRKVLLKQIGIATLCIQPMFSKSDYWMNERIGKARSRFAYPFKTLLRLTSMIGGSDAPVESIDPLTGIEAALENENQKESLSIKESIDLYTENAALASPITRDCGIIAPEKICDLVILSCRDLREIERAKVDATFIKGKLINRRLDSIKYTIDSTPNSI